MSGRVWNSMEDACNDGYGTGVREAAEDLMVRLREAGVRDGYWNGGDVVSVVEAWLQDKGVDTSVQPDA